MIKVESHGNRTRVQNPVNGQWQEMVNVRFVEVGTRGGANKQLSGSSNALTRAIGKNVGLETLRVHTQPVLAGTINEFPVGKEFNLFINRSLFSTPQMGQQEGRDARMVDGKPTYFTTEISEREEEDVDMRLENSVLAEINPGAFAAARVSMANVEILQPAGAGAGNLSSSGLGQQQQQQQ